jgi:hypothetical protein
MRVVDRLHGVWTSRGALGFVRFMLSRLYTKRSDLVFEANTFIGADDREWIGIGKLLCIGKENLAEVLTPQVRQQVFSGEGADYLAGLEREDRLFLVLDGDGNCLHHSFVLFDTRTKRLLGEAVSVPLFAHCVTRADVRGKHLYPRVMRYALAVLATRGYTRAVVNCDPGNRASVAGIQRAGFRLVRTLQTQIFCSWAGWQEVREIDGKSTTRFFVG